MYVHVLMELFILKTIFLLKMLCDQLLHLRILIMINLVKILVFLNTIWNGLKKCVIVLVWI